MVLADLGADVLRVDRPGGGFGVSPYDVLTRSPALGGGRPQAPGRGRGACCASRTAPTCSSRACGPASPSGSASARTTALRPQRAPRLRPDDRLGAGRPARAARRPRPRLPRAHRRAVDASASAGGPPVPPLNLVADFGGGSMLLVAGVLAALVERATSGRGQVVDAAMVDGVSTLLAMTWGMRAAGAWQDARGSNLLDGGAPFYATYECADGGWLAVGAIEPQFWAVVVEQLGPARRARRSPTSRQWPELRRRVAEAVAAPHARRVGGGLRAARRLRRAGPHPRRGRRAPAPAGPRDARRARRRGAAGAVTAPQPHAGRRSAVRRPRPARTRAPPCRTGASRPTSWPRLERDGHRRPGLTRAHQPSVPGAPLNGPTTSSVIQPP